MPEPRKPTAIYVKFDRRYHGRPAGPGVVEFAGYKSALESLAAWGTSQPQWEYRVTQVSEEPIGLADWETRGLDRSEGWDG